LGKDAGDCADAGRSPSIPADAFAEDESTVAVSEVSTVQSCLAEVIVAGAFSIFFAEVIGSEDAIGPVFELEL
jgi:hypothetical protein